MSEYEVLAICGSLRKDSFNRRLLDAAADLAPAGVRVTVYEGLEALPPFNADKEDAPGPAVLDLLRQVEKADGLLLATPEYNYSIPGVLKNAIDWLSRPIGGVRRLEHKPVAIMGAAPTRFGSVRAQLDLRQVFLWTRTRVVGHPEVMVTHAAEHFDVEGRLTDGHARELIAALLGALAAEIAAAEGAALATSP